MFLKVNKESSVKEFTGYSSEVKPTLNPNVAGHKYRSTIIENFLRSL